MEKPKALRIKFQESGGGWGNPLMGRVFDSDRDVSEEKFAELMELVEHCDLQESGELPGRPPMDVGTFELCVEGQDKAITLVGDMLRANEELQKLISFMRDHGRKEMLDTNPSRPMEANCEVPDDAATEVEGRARSEHTPSTIARLVRRLGEVLRLRH